MNKQTAKTEWVELVAIRTFKHNNEKKFLLTRQASAGLQTARSDFSVHLLIKSQQDPARSARGFVVQNPDHISRDLHMRHVALSLRAIDRVSLNLHVSL